MLLDADRLSLRPSPHSQYGVDIPMDINLDSMGAETGGSILCQLLLCVQTGEPFTIDPKRWFLDGFCPLLQPKLSLLLTAGDVMESRRLNKLWHAYTKSTPVVFEYQMSVSR